MTAHLTRHQHAQIVDWTWQGLSAYEIATRLGVSKRTVQRHRLRQGLRCRSTTPVQVLAGPCSRCGISTPAEQLTPVRKVCYTCAYGRPRGGAP